MSVKVIRMLSHHRRYVLTFVPEFQDRKPRENEFFLSITQLEKHSMRSLLTSDFYSYFFTTLVKRERKRKLENEGISKMKIVGVETRRWMVFFLFVLGFVSTKVTTITFFLTRSTQNFEEIFPLVSIHRANHFIRWD